MEIAPTHVVFRTLPGPHCIQTVQEQTFAAFKYQRKSGATSELLRIQ